MDNSKYIVSPEQYAQVHEAAYASAREDNNRAHSYSIAGSYMEAYLQQLANQQSMEFQTEQSELAYQRSTIEAQVRQFVNAGFSLQQARQIVAGSSAGSYTPATATIGSASGVDHSSATSADASVLNTLLGAASSAANFGRNLANDISSAVNDPTGGVIGSAMTYDLQGEILKNLDSLPTDAVTSFSGFSRFANSSSAPSWCKELTNSKGWTNAVHSVPGSRALTNFFGTLTEYATGEARLAGLHLSNRRENISIALANEQLTQEQIASARASIQWAYDEPNMQTFSQEKYLMARNTILKMSADNELMSDPTYAAKYIAKNMSDLDQQALYFTALKAIYTGEMSFLNDPNNAAVMGVYQAFNQVGITKNDVGAILATIQASGVPLTENVRAFVNSVLGGITPQKVQDFANGIIDSIDTTIEEGSDKANAAIGRVKQFIYTANPATNSQVNRVKSEFDSIMSSDIPYWKKIYKIGQIQIPVTPSAYMSE